ncbi:MAG: restriction endonuclease subunit S [Pirellulaceae bacterium]|nr:restriction endonuclease subunit S [Pirellulaceae bacterium]
MVRTQDIITGIFRLEQAIHVSVATYRERIKRAEPRHGDLVYSREGTYFGIAAEVPANCQVCLGQRMVLIRPSASQVHHRYLRYWLNCPLMAAHIHGFRDGTVAERLNLPTIRALPVLLPPLPEQRAIAHILGTLDDKIELNRRMNETLEAMARALFKSWFVDFDPVRAKMDGRHPEDMDADTAKLFPDKLEHQHGELIPAGWKTCPLYDTARFINGAAFRSEHFCEPSKGLPVVKIAELKSGITNQTKFSNRTDLEPKYCIDTGTIMYSWSGSPDTSLDTFLWTHGAGLLNQHIFRVEPKSTMLRPFVFFLLKYLRPTLIEIARNKQTTGLGHVTVADMRQIQVCWPPKAIHQAFCELAGPLFESYFTKTLESQTLSSVRDTLLPKLLSGELRIPEAERELESAL